MSRGRAWRQRRRKVLERDGYRCRGCGRAGPLQIHHRTALEDGGSEEPDNLVALCRDCHQLEHGCARPRWGAAAHPDRAAWRRLLLEDATR